MRKAFAIEFDLPESFTEAELQLVHDALARIDKYIPGGARVVNVLPFEAWTGTALDPNQTDDLGEVVSTIRDRVPEAFPQSTPPAHSGGPVRVSTAAIPKLAGPLAEQFTPPEVTPADPAAPTFLFPKGAPSTESPEESGTEDGEFLTLTIRRDILAAMAKGAYYEEAAKFYAAILAAMPADRQSVLISADDWA